MTTACQKCRRIGPVYAFANGLLQVCAACAPTTDPCLTTPHVWRGTAIGGPWICHACGQTLSSRPITPPVDASEA